MLAFKNTEISEENLEIIRSIKARNELGGGIKV